MVLETLRDIMEAFVIYSFLALVLEYAGGKKECREGGIAFVWGGWEDGIDNNIVR